MNPNRSGAKTQSTNADMEGSVGGGKRFDWEILVDSNTLWSLVWLKNNSDFCIALISSIGIRVNASALQTKQLQNINMNSNSADLWIVSTFPDSHRCVCTINHHANICRNTSNIIIIYRYCHCCRCAALAHRWNFALFSPHSCSYPTLHDQIAQPVVSRARQREREEYINK